MKNVFENVPDDEMRFLYEQILAGRDTALRPRCMDPYIHQVMQLFSLTFGQAWRSAEQMFFEEIAKRYFK